MATLPACPLLLDLQIKELNAWAGDHTQERGPGLGGDGAGGRGRAGAARALGGGCHAHGSVTRAAGGGEVLPSH